MARVFILAGPEGSRTFSPETVMMTTPHNRIPSPSFPWGLVIGGIVVALILFAYVTHLNGGHFPWSILFE